MAHIKSMDSREWRGSRATYLGAYRKYDYPVNVYKIGESGERELIRVETPNR